MSADSLDIVQAVKFMLDVGGVALDQKTIPKILEKIAAVDRPSAPLMELKGHLEAVVDSDYNKKLLDKLPERVNIIAKNAEKYGRPSDPDRPKLEVMC